MNANIPWYQSGIIRQQVVAAVLALLGLFNATDVIDVEGTVSALFAGAGAVVALYTIWTRLFKPTPVITETAAVKAAEFEAKQAAKQGGFADLRFLWLVACIAWVGIIAAGCVGTKAAYTSAQSLDETAYVVTEHYAAVLKEAADLRQTGALPANVVAAMQRADDAARPVVLSLGPLALAFREAQTAQTEAELQAAVNRSVLLLSDFINAVKAARSRT